MIHDSDGLIGMIENVSSMMQELPGLSTEKVQQLIALKVVKDQMESEQALAAELVDMSVQFRPDTYMADGQPSSPQPGSNVDVRA